jgi:hypothetical protein
MPHPARLQIYPNSTDHPFPAKKKSQKIAKTTQKWGDGTHLAGQAGRRGESAAGVERRDGGKPAPQSRTEMDSPRRYKRRGEAFSLAAQIIIFNVFRLFSLPFFGIYIHCLADFYPYFRLVSIIFFQFLLHHRLCSRRKGYR